MSRRTILFVVLALVGAFFQADRSRAQVTQIPFGDTLSLTQPVILAGPDVGFRLIRMDGSIPVGQIVVRINGSWVAAETTR